MFAKVVVVADYQRVLLGQGGVMAVHGPRCLMSLLRSSFFITVFFSRFRRLLLWFVEDVKSVIRKFNEISTLKELLRTCALLSTARFAVLKRKELKDVRKAQRRLC